MYTVASIFSTALQMFGGASQGSFRSPNQTVSSAILEVTNNVTLVESRRVVPLLPAIYGGEYLYPIGNDVDKIIDIIPMSGRSTADFSNFTKTTSNNIKNDVTNSNKLFNIEYRNGVRVLRIDNGMTADLPINLFPAESLTADGTVTVSGDANTLTLNTIMQLSGVAALDFKITPSTNSAVLQVVGITAKNITTITKDGSFTLGIFVPLELVGFLSSISLKIGNDALTNTLTMSATQNMYGGAFIHGCNFVQFKYNTGTTAGTFDTANVTALQVTLAHSSVVPVSGVLIDGVNAHKGLGYNLEYYSRFHFISSTGALIETATSVGLDDKVITSQEGYNLIVHECRKLMDFELKGGGGGEVYQISEVALNGTAADKYNKTRQKAGAYDEYRQRHPSETKPLITAYN